MISDAQLAARRKGGLACKARYGPEFYAAIGRRGGRPRAVTIKEVRERRELEAVLVTEMKEDARSPGLLQSFRRRRERRVAWRS